MPIWYYLQRYVISLMYSLPEPCNTGGTGDIAVLGVCKRMNLMAFAQISSRIGGGIMLVVAIIKVSGC